MAHEQARNAKWEQVAESREEQAARTLGVEFRDLQLLRTALTHRSYLNERGVEGVQAIIQSNERLEFLGDSVLGMITAEFLYKRYPEIPEGSLTAYRTALVRTETLARWAKRFRLDEFMYLGRGESTVDGEIRDRILAGAFEAVIAALYLDRGILATRGFLRELLLGDADEMIRASRQTNYKGRLQELIQDRHRTTPIYRTLDISGPAHERIFTVEVLVNGRPSGMGVGSSKRVAQQEAARRALTELAAEGVSEDDGPV